MTQSAQKEKIFSILSSETPSLKYRLAAILVQPLEQLFGLRGCETVYRQVACQEDPACFMKQSLAVLNIRSSPEDPLDREKIPKKGGCVVVANHPFGAIEGVILAELLLSVRSDVKIMANFLLDRIPQMRPLTIAVDPFDGKGAARANIGSIRKAMQWVKEGGLLMVFPAGEVSHYNFKRREIADPPWNHTVARIVRYAQASVVPIHFKGRNSALFQLAGQIHPRLRTLLLARELLKKRGKEITFKIGNPINYRWLQQYQEDDHLTDYLRWRTYIIGHARKRTLKLSVRSTSAVNHRGKPLAEPQSPQDCLRDIHGLPPSHRLTQSGVYTVWCAHAAQIPHILPEIGRLREISFRTAGEGTGKPLDLDRFDENYLHLFIWNEETREIVGAYRLGRTDDILAAKGRRGLYTSTLFHSRMDFFNKLGPALEMGRSFIRPEYQKSYASLLLLWKGIGAYVARHPRYRMLFGPVSISSDYSDLSRRLLATTLLRHSQAGDLALMVRPRKPARLKPIRICGCDRTTHDVAFKDFKEVCSVVSDIEIQQKDVPVLLRQYLNLGGQLLSFNIDKLFSNVMDGLIVVDLLQTDRKTLARYMGGDGLASFLTFYGVRAEEPEGASLSVF